MRTLTRKLKQITFLSFIFIISLAFNFQHNPSSNWYQQFLPNINGRPISDMIFTDSLTGYIVTSYISNDTSYILKTTTGGDNWNIVFRQPTNTVGGFNSIKFISLTIGFACGNFLWKTTNEGINWFNINTSGIFPEHMHILNQDTLWIIDSESLTGGVFRTTNGGVNWTQQLSLGSLNPTGIYMVNGRTGFISSNGGGAYVMKTTNSGVNWFTVVSGEGFSDMHFIDTLTGWRSYGTLKKTTDGGLNWINQTLPIGGNIIESAIGEFSVINKDTLWGVGGFKFYPGSGNRGMIYRTTNGGLNWYYQIPDTSIHINVYYFCQFTDKNHGWAYHPLYGVHTINGGDTSFVTDVRQLSSEVPKDFRLNQNYPNPFNPTTFINYELQISSFISLKVYNLQGKEITTLVNKKQNSGNYTIEFNASNLSSGIYFYTLQTDRYTQTKKMMLVK